ncbi:hypothetical protein I5Q34_24650 [Streptomyces sp. AV19]|uniref:hypothetical protein n=1 Tax=Streptomyces sp. AV19 TaxID=2793068 RepID=UPI0018FE5FFC|nr:hypothetical protein [Streptomyces sp. AV19]MBH1937419.1 hypothetical protein [Streptomyces sp. AV19]MDG4533808.1 hypothetical protein [Streptomyces sp. AV19]
MSPTASDRSRPEEINDAIRAFLTDRDGHPLTPAERRQYEVLRARWLEAVRRRHGRAGP